MPLAFLVLSAVVGYLLGSIPFGLLLTRLIAHRDLRAIGSGNIGATNVLRTGRKDLAAATLFLDSGKGAVAVLLANGLFGREAALAAGFAAVLGHLFPLWLAFKGGKGVATSFGMLAAAAWPVGLASVLTWLAVAALSRLSSLAALVAVSSSPLWAWFITHDSLLTLCSALLVPLIWLRHRDNIARLLQGTETRIGKGPPKEGEELSQSARRPAGNGRLRS